MMILMFASYITVCHNIMRSNVKLRCADKNKSCFVEVHFPRSRSS